MECIKTLCADPGNTVVVFSGSEVRGDLAILSSNLQSNLCAPFCPTNNPAPTNTPTNTSTNQHTNRPIKPTTPQCHKLEDTFGALPVWLAAENGVYLRGPTPQSPPRRGGGNGRSGGGGGGSAGASSKPPAPPPQWVCLFDTLPKEWMDSVQLVLDYFCERTPRWVVVGSRVWGCDLCGCVTFKTEAQIEGCMYNQLINRPPLFNHD
jgi:hypothetical protein